MKQENELRETKVVEKQQSPLEQLLHKSIRRLDVEQLS